MKKYFKYILLFVLAIGQISCNEDSYEDVNLPSAAVSEMSGDWYVQVFVDDVLEEDYFLITTSNTPDSETEIQINDHKNFWWMNVAVPVDLSTLTFSGNDLLSSVEDDDVSTEDIYETYDVNVTITNGTIVKGGTVTTGTGNEADLISFDIEFADDPGTIYHFEGYKRSGFLEDEH